MQLCSWKRPGLLECGKVCLVYPGWLSGFGFVHISSEIGPESSCKLSCGRTAEPSMEHKNRQRTSIFKCRQGCTGFWGMLREIYDIGSLFSGA